ncbi:MAG: helix-turn-helix transcriptional regulator [Desulfobacterales bacterium]|nr:helix-turn-helix transcriptional regulator [Desulfobacterales bacterium]
MDEITNRLNKLVDEFENGNAAAFARKAKIMSGTLNNYLKGRKPSVDSLINICNAYKVDLNWLIIGSDEMLRKINNSKDEILKENIERMEYPKNHPDLACRFPLRLYKYVPTLDRYVSMIVNACKENDPMLVSQMLTSLADKVKKYSQQKLPESTVENIQNIHKEEEQYAEVHKIDEINQTHNEPVTELQATGTYDEKKK